jgi:DNA mismatch repair protein MutH
MKQQAQSIQYTIRGIPSEVDRALRKEARRRKQSVNQVVVEALTGATVGERAKADFSDLVGQWTPDGEFDQVLAAQRRIDPGKWR